MPCGCTPVSLAISCDQLEIAELLIQKGMSTSGVSCAQKITSGCSSVQLAAAKPTSAAILKMLLHRQPKQSMHLDHKLHPLRIAVLTRNHDGLRSLIDHCTQGNLNDQSILAYQGGFDLSHKSLALKITTVCSQSFPVSY